MNDDVEIKKELKYLALGDSYTIGESVGKNEKYPVQLADSILSSGTDIKLRIIARTGWTTDELSDAIKESKIEEKFDIVSLLIGVNNQYRGRDADEYRIQFMELLQTAIDFADGNTGRVLVLSIPDWGVTPFAEGRDKVKISSEIDLFNKINKEVSEESGVKYFYITDISRIPDPELIAVDGLHPSGKMYAEWVNRIMPYVLKIISEN
ncbi:MAG: SGNH/GDSL hydrolase family protein [Melioribacteraceae bacterium]|nr:SGNH/GDSL hydrolase family protein [Melioribacteraceae bacterium]